MYIERIEDFMELVDLNKPTSIFVKKYSELTENKLLHGHIRMQFKIGDDIINYQHVEDIPKVQLPLSDAFLDGAALFIDTVAVKAAGTKIDESIKMFYKILDEQYAKAKEIFKARGIKVIEGFVQ
jgi:hypothetical protein